MQSQEKDSEGWIVQAIVSYILITLYAHKHAMHSAFSSVIGIVLNPTLKFNDYVVVHSLSDFFYSVAWMGSISTIAGTIAGQTTGFFADRYV